jgi:hypothetical protein
MALERTDKTHISSLSIPKNTPLDERTTKKNIVTFYRTKKEGNISVANNNNNVKDPYQFLCIMSESKKLEQIQRIKERR